MNAPSFTEHVVTTLSEGVAHIELARPDKLNSLSRPMLDALVETLRWAGVNPEVRAILISGHGRIFCAGDDLDGLGDLHGAPSDQQIADKLWLTFAEARQRVGNRTMKGFYEWRKRHGVVPDSFGRVSRLDLERALAVRVRHGRPAGPAKRMHANSLNNLTRKER